MKDELMKSLEDDVVISNGRCISASVSPASRRPVAEPGF